MLQEAQYHTCSLPNTTNLLFKQETDWEKCKTKIFKAITLSRYHPETKYYFRSQLQIYHEKERHYNSKFYFIIHPFSSFRLYYDIYLLFLYIIAILLKPLSVGFIAPEWHSHRIDFIKIALLLLNILCIIDIILTFFTGYIANRVTIFDPRYIAINYLRSPLFFCDLVSSVPKHVLYNSGIIGQTGYIVLTIFEVFKCARAYSVRKYYNQFIDYMKIQRNICAYLIILGLVLYYINHLLACTHFLVPRIRKWTTGKYHPHSWIMRRKIADMPLSSQYIRGMFRTAVLCLTVYIKLEDRYVWDEYVTLIFNLIVGKMFTLLIWIIIFTTIMNSKSSEIQYQEFIDQLNVYMRQNKPELKHRLTEYYEYKYKRNYFKTSLIENIFSRNLMKDINTHVCRQLVRNVAIFRELSEDVVKSILNSLVLEIFLPNDMIIKAGTYGNTMYFLSTGTVAVYTYSGREVCHLQDGSYFGEISLVMQGHKRNATVVSIEICELYRLDRKPFEHYIMNNASLYQKIVIEAERRLVQTRDLEEKYQKMLFKKTYRA